MEFLKENFLILLPIIIIDLLLFAVALRHCLKHNAYKRGNRLIWVCLITFIQIAGPILYFTFGSEE